VLASLGDSLLCFQRLETFGFLVGGHVVFFEWWTIPRVKGTVSFFPPTIDFPYDLPLLRTPYGALSEADPPKHKVIPALLVPNTFAASEFPFCPWGSLPSRLARNGQRGSHDRFPPPLGDVVLFFLR